MTTVYNLRYLIVASAMGETINKLHFCIVTEVLMIIVMRVVIIMVMRVAMIIDMEVVMVIVMRVEISCFDLFLYMIFHVKMFSTFLGREHW